MPFLAEAPEANFYLPKYVAMQQRKRFFKYQIKKEIGTSLP